MSEKNDTKMLESFLAAETMDEFKGALFGLIDSHQRNLRSPISRRIGDVARNKMEEYKKILRNPDVSEDEIRQVAIDFFDTKTNFGGMDLESMANMRPKIGSQYKQLRDKNAPSIKVMGKEFLKQYPRYLPAFGSDAAVEMPEGYRAGGRTRLI
tara:strand:- start:604 stop:1065 length:462 start_codon:yes stop_codon:yes gene_type:complete